MTLHLFPDPGSDYAPHELPELQWEIEDGQPVAHHSHEWTFKRAGRTITHWQVRRGEEIVQETELDKPLHVVMGAKCKVNIVLRPKWK